MSNDFKELQSLLNNPEDFQDDEADDEMPEFHAPVIHKEGTSLARRDQQEIDDFNYVRETLLNMIEKGQISIEVAVRELTLSGHPRAAEVVGSLIKNIGDVSDKLLDLHKKIEEARNPSGRKEGGDGPRTQNNIFVGSPDELLKTLEKLQKNNQQEEFIDVEHDRINEDIDKT